MNAPYASVILPTFDRSSTLPYALASVQRQSEPALEIVVVLDGATDPCRDIAVAAARSDPRIVVLDLIKAPSSRQGNADIAVRRARGSRIFYIDDDDLWLPDHVARLGPLLDDADIADSRVCSLDRRGALHLGPCRGSNRRLRELLAAGKLKMLYDTHLAHRSDAYPRFSSWIRTDATGDVVWSLLSGFAQSTECRWVSCDQVTAVSIHGGARRDMSPPMRAGEISDWLNRLPAVGDMLSRADSLFHLFRLLMIDRPSGGSLAHYLSDRGGYACEPSRREQDLFALFAGPPPDQTIAVELAVALSEPVESGYMFESIALACFDAYGQETHERILSQAASRPGPNIASRLAAYSVAASRRDRKFALALAEQAVSLGPDPIGSLARWRDKLRCGPA